MKYICTVCGFVYDEEKEGKSWDEVSEDYKCPLCSVGKEMFEKLEV